MYDLDDQDELPKVRVRTGHPDDSERFRKGRAPKGWYRQPESRSNWERARSIRKRQRICRP